MERGFASRQSIAGLSALLDHHGLPTWAHDALPPLGHWLCFPPDARQSSLGIDGHPLRHDDHPDLPRRMWAGGRIRFLASIAYDGPIARHTRLVSSVAKNGRSGRLQLVTLRHEIFSEDTLAIVEEQDLVYREAAAATPGTYQSERPEAGILRQIVPDETLLFRYSALTFNAHRIHYDRPYATEVEHYPTLVVHGPLTATLLVDHYLRTHPERVIRSFDFRAVAPLYCGRTLALLVDGDTLAAHDEEGRLAMSAQVAHG